MSKSSNWLSRRKLPRGIIRWMLRRLRNLGMLLSRWMLILRSLRPPWYRTFSSGSLRGMVLVLLIWIIPCLTSRRMISHMRKSWIRLPGIRMLMRMRLHIFMLKRRSCRFKGPRKIKEDFDYCSDLDKTYFIFYDL